MFRVSACSEKLTPVVLTVEAVAKIGDTDSFTCSQPLQGLHISLVVPDSDDVELGVTDVYGRVEVSAAAGTYSLRIDDTVAPTVVYDWRDPATPADTFTVPDAYQPVDNSFWAPWFPTPKELFVPFFVPSGEDHCPSCEELAASPEKTCLGNVERSCDGNGLYQLIDCTELGKVCGNRDSPADSGVVSFGCVDPPPSN